MRGLIIEGTPVDKILNGQKTWEIRGKQTHIRGKIALIRKGSKQVVGTCNLVDVKGPLSLAEIKRTVSKHQVSLERLRRLPYKNGTYAWVVRNAKRLRTPIPYEHPRGAVVWVTLSESISRRLVK